MPILNQLLRNNKIHLITSFVFFAIYFVVFYYGIHTSNWSERTTTSKLSFIMKCAIGLGFLEVFRLLIIIYVTYQTIIVYAFTP